MSESAPLINPSSSESFTIELNDNYTPLLHIYYNSDNYTRFFREDVKYADKHQILKDHNVDFNQLEIDCWKISQTMEESTYRTHYINDQDYISVVKVNSDNYDLVC